MNSTSNNKYKKCINNQSYYILPSDLVNEINIDYNKKPNYEFLNHINNNINNLTIQSKIIIIDLNQYINTFNFEISKNINLLIKNLNNIIKNFNYVILISKQQNLNNFKITSKSSILIKKQLNINCLLIYNNDLFIKNNSYFVNNIYLFLKNNKNYKFSKLYNNYYYFKNDYILDKQYNINVYESETNLISKFNNNSFHLFIGNVF